MFSIHRAIGTWTTSWLAVLVLGAAACRSAAPMTPDVLPTMAEVEKRLWSESRDRTRRLDQSGVLHESKELQAYVNTVAQRLLPASLRIQDAPINVKVIKNPYFNAFTFPHGAIYIHSGLLAAMENEAQLAALLGHEIAHFNHRHAYVHLSNRENVSVSFQVLAMGAGGAGLFSPLVSLFGLFTMNAAVSGYSQSLEWEADDTGLDLAMKAGYDPREAVKLFEILEREVKDRDKDQPFFFGSHPRLTERRDHYRQLVESHHAGRTGEIGADKFNDETAVIKLENVEINIAQGRWDWAESALVRFLSRYGHDPRGHYLLGELFRRRNKTEDRERAERAYKDALALDDRFALAHRGLGLLHERTGDAEKAHMSFRRYLELAPGANDRAHIESQLANQQIGRMP